jgi:uncharacterized protein YdhG (YjbR/CyaY superfamily)
MAAPDIDAYLATLDPDQRAALGALRRQILQVVPDAEEVISYGMPGFKVRGKTVAGFAAFKNHLSYLPHSGSVLAALVEDLAAYEKTQGSLHFSAEEGLPDGLVRKLVETRLREAGLPLPGA